MLNDTGTINSARAKEKTVSVIESITSGFINEAVLIPDVLRVIISLFLTIRIRKISIEIRNDKGRIRFK